MGGTKLQQSSEGDGRVESLLAAYVSDLVVGFHEPARVLEKPGFPSWYSSHLRRDPGVSTVLNTPLVDDVPDNSQRHFFDGFLSTEVVELERFELVLREYPPHRGDGRGDLTKFTQLKTSNHLSRKSRYPTPAPRHRSVKSNEGMGGQNMRTANTDESLVFTRKSVSNT